MPKGESVNISSLGQIAISELIEKIAKEMNYAGEIIYKNARNADVQCHNASNQKMLNLIEFSPMPFDEGLKITLDWYVKNIDN